MTSQFSPRLLAALDEVQVAADGRSAIVQGVELAGESQRDLLGKLSRALYDALHSGLTKESSALRPRRDRAFETELAAVVPHPTTEISAMVHEVHEEQILVERDGVRVWVPRATGNGNAPSPGSRVTLQVNPVRAALSPGFLLVDSAKPPHFEQPQLRVYIHLTDPDHAPAVWGAALSALAATEVSYRAKVISMPGHLPRRDGMVVYLGRGAWHAARIVAEAVAGMPGTGSQTSVLTEEMAPGVATAWEPVDERAGMRGLSFGEHRSRVTAIALIEAATTGEPREQRLLRDFQEARIDPRWPARNTG
ncbi:T3SS effector HopA1 family protein [Streptomyces sp. NPDC050355]|uniref:T3SS effector HopA1 family protein n=1 Tax=Streptomyces sirii TaxID=3127701 RepID=A0ABZ2QYG1_9ACTN